jgi:RES domain-containing protein
LLSLIIVVIKLRPNPQFAEFRDLLTAKPELFQPWTGTLFRFQTVEFPSPQDVLSGLGAKQRGGRWNPPGLAALYGSTTDATALEESKANDRYAGIVNRSPRLLVAVEARLARVLDFTSATVRRQLGVTLTELRAEDWRKLLESGRESFTQALGRVAFRAGASGLLARSAAVFAGVNGAVFPGNLRKGEGLAVVEGEKLRRLAPKE